MKFEDALTLMKRGRILRCQKRSFRWTNYLESFEDNQWRPTIFPLNSALLYDWTTEAYSFQQIVEKLVPGGECHARSVASGRQISRYENAGICFKGCLGEKPTFTIEEVLGLWELI